MSVQYILNSDYNTIKNEKLTQALEVSTSLKAPVHYVDDIALSNNAGKLNSTATIEATQLEAPIAVVETVNVGELIPQDGEDGVITVLGALNSSTDTQSLMKNVKMSKLESWVHGSGTVGQVLSLDANLDLQWKNDSSGDVSTWSTYPATQDVNMNNKNITGVINMLNAVQIGSSIAYFDKISPVTYGQGTNGQILSLDASAKLRWINPPSGASTWSTYPATSSVDMGGLDIYNMGSLICNGTLQANQATPTSGTFTINGVGKAGNFENIYSGNENTLYIVKADTIRTITNGNGTANQILSQDSSNKLKWIDQPTASNWSSYDASSDINANSNGITNLLSLTLDGGVAGTEDQVLSVDGSGNLKWKTDASGDVSTWSTYPATQNVDMGNFEVQNASKVVATEVDVNEYTIVQGNSTVEPSMKSLIINPPENYGYVTIGNSTNAGNVEIVGDGTFNAYDGAMVASYHAVWNATNSLEQTYLDTNGLIIKDKATSTQDMFILNANTSVARLPYINRDQNSTILYVVPNTNLSGVQNGTIEAPFNSVKLAVDWVNANGATNTTYTINIDNGSYSDTIDIEHPNINLVGSSQNVYGATKTVITGVVNLMFPGSSGNLHGHQCSFNNLHFTENILNQASMDVCVNFKNCYFYVDSIAYSDIGSSAQDSRLRFMDCFMQSTNASATDPLVSMKLGMLAMNLTQMEVAGNVPCLSLSGTSTVDVINMCKFTSNVANSTSPIVDITSTAGGSYSFANCGFIYTSASTNACAGISSHPASGTNNVIVSYCSFYMTGLAQSAGNYCIKSSNTVVLYFSNNALVGYANAIEGSQGVNKFSMSAVV